MQDINMLLPNTVIDISNWYVYTFEWNYWKNKKTWKFMLDLAIKRGLEQWDLIECIF